MGIVRFILAARLRVVACAVLLMLLGGCALDEEEELRKDLSRLVYLAQTKHFTSQSTCTVAVFYLALPQMRSGGPRRVDSVRAAVPLIARGQAVAFALPDTSPSIISEQLMSMDLGRGLGLLSSGVGPILSCVSEQSILNGLYAVITSPETRLVYDPAGNSLLMVYPPEALAVFLRGNV